MRFRFLHRVTGALLMALMALLLSAAVPTAATAQAVYYVDADAAPGGDGTSWSTAFDALPDALAVAQAGDAVWIAAGTYVPGPARSDAFTLADGVALLGGFTGSETSPTERTLGAAETVLSGDNDGDGAPTGNAYHVVTAPAGVTGSATLDRLTITGGNADGSSANGSGADGCGGGLRLDGASPTLQNVRVVGNQAVRGGGLCLTGGAAPTVANALVAENAATEAGGGVYAAGGSAGTFTHATITANTAPTGGGLYALDSAPTVQSSIVWDNAGGSIANAASYALTLNSVVVGEDPGTGHIVYDDAPGDLEELTVEAGPNTYTFDMLDKTHTETITVPSGVEKILISHNDADYINTFAANNTWNEPLPDWNELPDYQSTNRYAFPDPNASNTLAIPVDDLNQNGTSTYRVSMIPATMPLGEDTKGSYETPLQETSRWTNEHDNVIWSAIREDDSGNLRTQEEYDVLKSRMDDIEAVINIPITREEYETVQDFIDDYGLGTSRDLRNTARSSWGNNGNSTGFTETGRIYYSNGSSSNRINFTQELFEQFHGFDDAPNLYTNVSTQRNVPNDNARQFTNIVQTLLDRPDIE